MRWYCAWILCTVCFFVSQRAVPERMWRDIQRHLLCMHVDLWKWSVPERMRRLVSGLLCSVHVVPERAVPRGLFGSVFRLLCDVHLPMREWAVSERMWRHLRGCMQCVCGLVPERTVFEWLRRDIERGMHYLLQLIGWVRDGSISSRVRWTFRWFVRGMCSVV